MKDGKIPNPNTLYPFAGYDKEIYVKPTITNPNIVVGDFTYIADSDFESHVTHLYAWNGDKLIIGNPARILRKRFDDAFIDLMLQFKWWDKNIEEINALIPLLTCSDLERVKTKVKELMDKS